MYVDLDGANHDPVWRFVVSVAPGLELPAKDVRDEIGD